VSLHDDSMFHLVFSIPITESITILVYSSGSLNLIGTLPRAKNLRSVITSILFAELIIAIRKSLTTMFAISS
jgi:hypothetical protein